MKSDLHAGPGPIYIDGHSKRESVSFFPNFSRLIEQCW